MKRDLSVVAGIGVLIGTLAQPVLSNVFVVTPALRAGVFVGCVLFAPFALFVAHILGKYIPAFYQFAKFGAVGTLNTLIDLGVLNCIIFATGITAGVAYSVIKGFSFLIATTNSFAWNRYWTFNTNQSATSSEAVKFYGVAIAGWVVNLVVASYVVNSIGIPDSFTEKQWANVGALSGILATFLWNFLWYKFWVFKAATIADEKVK